MKKRPAQVVLKLLAEAGIWFGRQRPEALFSIGKAEGLAADSLAGFVLDQQLELAEVGD